MTEVLFYHLERSKLEDVLPDLLEKTLDRGWRAVVCTRTNEAAAALDEALWVAREESFLPHAAGGDAAFAARQPVWITASDDAPNGAQVLFLVEGAARAPDALSGFARCVSIFDGADAAATEAARVFWKACKEAGHAVAYWRQTEEGRWEKRG
ncbi:MAG: DNA polymerase III subunit chi [Parvularculaceae bacterium]|nr:DNA polymerase III subunit chi [Parvularculaceae bacterium]